MRHTISSVNGSITTLVTAIALFGWMSLKHTLPATGSAASALTATYALLSTSADIKVTVDDYQPPDQGGPDKSGGAGTRWQ